MNFYDVNTPKARDAFAKFPYKKVKGAKRIAFTGTRCPGLSAGVAGIVASSLKHTLSGTDYKISVGDAKGVDREVAENLWNQPHTIFEVEGRERKHFAQRSVRCLESVLPRQSAKVLAFPHSKCPDKVDTKPRFAGRGSGTWGTVGLALGHGIPVIMYVPPKMDPLKWCGPLKKYATVLVDHIPDSKFPEVSDCGSWIELNRTIQIVQPSLFI